MSLHWYYGLTPVGFHVTVLKQKSMGTASCGVDQMAAHVHRFILVYSKITYASRKTSLFLHTWNTSTHMCKLPAHINQSSKPKLLYTHNHIRSPQECKQNDHFCPLKYL